MFNEIEKIPYQQGIKVKEAFGIDEEKGNEDVFAREGEHGNVSSQKKSRKFEFKDPSEKIRDILRKENILVNMGGVNVFDVEEFLSDPVQEKIRKTTIDLTEEKKKSITKTMLFSALRDLKVLSWEDYLNRRKNNEDLVEKPLFNIPDSVEDAFDLEKIRNKEYYLNYWEIFGKEGAEQRPTWDHDMIAKDRASINMKEFSFATKLFRDFQAQRNSNGELEVFDPGGKEYVKLSSEWMRKNFGALGSYGEKYNSPQQFLLNDCQNLLQRGLIKLSDFRIITSAPTSKLLRKEFFPTNQNPYVMIGKARYYIGREKFIFEDRSFPINNIKIVVLNENTAGVVLVQNEREDVICVIDLLDNQERMEKTAESDDMYPTIGKKELSGRMHSWKRTDDNLKFQNETEEAYAKRMDAMADYGYVKKVTQDFSLQGVGIHNLSWREQQWLVSAALALGDDYQRMLEFGKKYQLDGLKTFLSCEYDLENGKKILELSEKLSFQSANLIFAKYNQISDIAERGVANLVKGYLRKNDKGITKDQHEKIAASLLQKSKDLLLDFSQLVSSEKDIDEEGLMRELEKTRTDVIFFTSVFKNFSKNNPEISFEDFKGLSFETLNGTEFRDEDISRMISIAQKNYQEDEAMQKLVIESLQEGLQKENSEFFVLRRGGEIMAFDRFDDEGEYFYVGSLNVDADYRGSAIGEIIMRESFDRKAKEKPLQGITDPKKIICSKYVEDEGFVISGILHTQFEGKELLEVEILRGDQKNQNYLYRSQNNSVDLFVAYQNQQKEFTAGELRRAQILSEKRPFLMSFDQKGELEKFTDLADKLIKRYGYVITRYYRLDEDGGRILVAFEQSLS
jgi:hypothetical protein